MARTTADAVEKILTKDYDPSVDVQPFIDTATLIVDRLVTYGTANRRPVLDTEAEMVERWLAAHYYSQSDKPYSARHNGVSSATFAGRTDKSLDSTLYGQTAMTLDPSGYLITIRNSSKAKLKWLGKRPGNQLDQEDRYY